MSTLSYGTNDPVFLPYCFATDFRQEAVYDDIGGTDWVYTKIDLTVQSVLNTDYLGMLAPDLIGQNATTVDIMNVIRSRLLKPRQKLVYSFNGINLIPAIQNGLPGTVDAKNGPMPQYCNIKQLTSKTFLINYRVVGHYWENHENPNETDDATPANEPGSDVLFNRWTESVDIDKDNFTVRIRDGKFVIRSDNPDGFIVDQVRSQFAVVGVPNGFLRVSSSYTVSPDGLSIRYRVVDKEVFKMPPTPAFTAEGQYYETSTKNALPLRLIECRVKLTGSKGTDQAVLLQTAIAVVQSKLNADPLRVFQIKGVPESCTIMVDMYENIVECRSRAMTKPASTVPGTGRVEGIWGLNTQAATFTPLSDDVPPEVNTPDYQDRGSASLLLQAAAYYDPSFANTVLDPITGNANIGTSPGTAGAVQENSENQPAGGPFTSNNPFTFGQPVQPPNVVISNLVPGPNDADYQDLSVPTGIWVDYAISGRYESDKHRFMMPVTDPNGFAQGTAAFVQLAAPTLLWIVDWTAAKLEETPEIPDSSILNDDGWILLDEHYEPYMISLAADGVTPIYRISGTFVYGNASPDIDPLVDLIYPKAPWVLPGTTDRIQTDDTRLHDVIDVG